MVVGASQQIPSIIAQTLILGTVTIGCCYVLALPDIVPVIVNCRTMPFDIVRYASLLATVVPLGVVVLTYPTPITLLCAGSAVVAVRGPGRSGATTGRLPRAGY
ncbi:MAG TPA: hypothetical protein VIL85_15630 [Thermomicrobiales bacterium]